MQSRIHKLAALAAIDSQLDELEEEYGDLPEQVKAAESKLQEKEKIVKETDGILKDVRQFKSSSKVTLNELKEKEEKLSKQQFLVRNNKEFDAITKEIENVKFEFNRLSDEMRTVGVKEENLVRMLDQQKKEAALAENELQQIQEELEMISSDQNEEVKDLKQNRTKLLKNIDKETLELYNRVRANYSDAVVQIRKNSCSGCFSSQPPQKIVEIRNNLDTIYSCENCGRILYPEELDINQS